MLYKEAAKTSSPQSYVSLKLKTHAGGKSEDWISQKQQQTRLDQSLTRIVDDIMDHYMWTRTLFCALVKPYVFNLLSSLLLGLGPAISQLFPTRFSFHSRLNPKINVFSTYAYQSRASRSCPHSRRSLLPKHLGAIGWRAKKVGNMMCCKQNDGTFTWGAYV